MADIYHYFPINASLSEVFNSVSTPEGLNRWWSKTSKGNLAIGETFTLFFGPKHTWTAKVSKLVSNKEFELTITDANSEWNDTKVGFILDFKNNITNVQFYHIGWKESSEHYRISCYCWAMYLRILKRYLEFGEEVSYENRLEV